MKVSRYAFFAIALLGLAACPSKDTDEGTTPTAAPSIAPAPPPATNTAPTDLRVDGPTATSTTPSSGKIEPRVKAELDGRADGITGSPLAVAGAKASMQSPTGWTQTKGAVTLSEAADKKAQLAASSVGPEGAAGKLPSVVSALGLTACEWAAPESLTVGKTKLAATAADGVCTRGTTQVRTAYVAPNAEALLVVGAWETGGDVANMFGAMRSIAKATGTGDSTGIGACCAALAQNAKSAPPDQQGALIAAAAACNQLMNDPQGRAVLGQVRALLRGANVPASCL
jgi:hypothetical protein